MKRLAPLVFALSIAPSIAACQGANKTGSGTATTSEKRLEVQQPAWPPSSAIDHAALSALSSEAQSNVSRATVPVLVPSDPALLAVGVVMREEFFYAFNARTGGVTVTLHGRRLAQQHDEIQPIAGDRSMRGTQGLVTVNEGIESASWMELGVSYALDVECEARDDVRCADDKYLLTVVEGLKYVGGAAK